MSWNYRVVRKKYPSQKLDSGVRIKGYVTYGIFEVYYNSRDKPYLVTVDPVDPFGENLQELKACYEMMAEAFTKPVLKYEDFTAKRSGQKR